VASKASIRKLLKSMVSLCVWICSKYSTTVVCVCVCGFAHNIVQPLCVWISSQYSIIIIETNKQQAILIANVVFCRCLGPSFEAIFNIKML